MHFSEIYSWNEYLHVSGSSSVHHQEVSTVHTAMVYVIQVCWQLASRMRMEHPVWHIPLLCVRWTTPDDGQRNCPKHVDQDQDGTSWSCSQAVSKPVWHIPLLCVLWKTPDDGQRNCPKHVEFHSKNKFEKLAHLVGFIIRTEDQYSFLIMCCSVLLRMRNVSDKRCRENQNTFYAQ
jgi:hypothetical protein